MIRWWIVRRQVLFWIVAVFVYVFLLAPFVVVAVSSVEGSQSYYFNFPPEQLSLAWYVDIPVSYYHAFGRSLLIAAVAALISTAIGTLAALGIVRGQVPGKEALQAFFRLPLQIPLVVTGVVFLQFYYQMADYGLNWAGTLPGLILAHIFITIPYSVGTVSAVLLRLNPRFEEVAESLGASRWSSFWRVTFPLLRPGIFAGVMYAFIISFGDVPVAVFLAGSNAATLPVEIFHALQFDFNPALLALSTIVVVFSLVLIMLLQKIGFDLVIPSQRR